MEFAKDNLVFLCQINDWIFVGFSHRYGLCGIEPAWVPLQFESQPREDWRVDEGRQDAWSEQTRHQKGDGPNHKRSSGEVRGNVAPKHPELPPWQLLDSLWCSRNKECKFAPHQRYLAGKGASISRGEGWRLAGPPKEDPTPQPIPLGNDRQRLPGWHRAVQVPTCTPEIRPVHHGRSSASQTKIQG